MGNNMILAPSPQGSLDITTTDGGAFETLAALQALQDNTTPPTSQLQFIMSDSSRSQYVFNADAFGISDHAAVPLHLNDPTSVALNISGDMNNVELVSPEAAQINVVGNMNNSSLVAQNLHSSDVTSITVGAVAKLNMENAGLLNPATDSTLKIGGDILNQGEFNDITLASAPDLDQLNRAVVNGVLTPLSDLASRLHYDAATGELTVQGQLNQTYENYLTSLTVQQYVNGKPVFNPDGTPVTTTVSILDPDSANELYQASLAAPTTQNPGYFIGGGGQFNVVARNVNLGSTLGIQAVGPGNGSRDLGKNPALANYFTTGADISLNLSGNLDMFSTTIASLNGGKITVNAGGYVDVGSPDFSGNDQNVRGIFTVGPADVIIKAVGDISLNGSRIAAYDGGNVTVESLTGNVDAGDGGAGSVSVEEIYVDPVTHRVFTYSPTIPGSGILATTFPPRNPSLFPAPEYAVGNILVETPQGNINASGGGILQLPLNNADSSGATVTLLAGEDAAGNIITPGEDINASGSGVIGSTIDLKASGDINGVIFARGNINVSAVDNVNVTALAEGTVNASAGGDISGTIIGVGGINASGGSIDASLLSQNVTSSGDVSGTVGFAQGTTANATSAAASSDANQTAANAATTTDNSDDDLKKKKPISLAQKVSRVTVILPTKTN
jgi:hypothetical protein